MGKELEKIAEVMLEQGIKELLYSFRKNGGDLDYCVSEIRRDFEKAGYRKPPDRPELENIIEEVGKVLRQDDGLALRVLRGHWEDIIPIVVALIDKPKAIHLKLTVWEGKPAIEFDDGDVFYQSETIGEFLMHLSILMPDCELPTDFYISPKRNEQEQK